MKSIRILMVDDHPVVRAGLRGMLASQEDFLVLDEASDGASAVALAETLRPDVVLLDLRMPQTGGLWAIPKLLALKVPPQILVLTTFDTDAEVFRAIEAGAIGYLLKDSPRDSLFSAIRAAAAGKPALAPAIAAKLMGRVRQAGGKALTLREIEVLQQVSRGSSNREIAKTLRISQATVKSHLIHIFEKLGVSDRTAAVTSALEKGIFSLGNG